eukprot:scaffold5890_cov110-Isochrysis_galbana.AAC.7
MQAAPYVTPLATSPDSSTHVRCTPLPPTDSVPPPQPAAPAEEQFTSPEPSALGRPACHPPRTRSRAAGKQASSHHFAVYPSVSTEPEDPKKTSVREGFGEEEAVRGVERREEGGALGGANVQPAVWREPQAQRALDGGRLGEGVTRPALARIALFELV